jgi:hypothetical protein
MTKTLITKICLLAGLTFLAGCKAGEVPTSGFIPHPELLSKDANLPFQRTYWDNKFDPNNYNEIFIAPVNTDYLKNEGFWEGLNLAYLDKEKLKKEIGDLADYAHKSFIKAFTEDPNHRFTVVDTAGPNTLVLETALVQVVPSRTVVGVIGCVSPATVAVVGTAAGAMSKSQDIGKGVVAIEGRFRDGRTREIVGMFADCEHPKYAFLDFKAINWWAPAKIIIDDWGKQLVEVLSNPRGTAIKGSPAFKLLVW